MHALSVGIEYMDRFFNGDSDSALSFRRFNYADQQQALAGQNLKKLSENSISA